MIFPSMGQQKLFETRPKKTKTCSHCGMVMNVERAKCPSCLQVANPERVCKVCGIKSVVLVGENGNDCPVCGVKF